MAFHPDGKHLVTSGRDRQLKVWRLSEPIYAVSISPDGNLLAAPDGLGQVPVYTLTGG